MKPDIKIINAEQNNLKQLTLTLPKHKITAFTGVSGSGKSSLVIDTLGAESQRLLNETYSSYIQNLLPHYDKPQVEAIENLPVSLIINQKKIGGNARSTVGTITDIYALLRLLFSRIGQPFVGYSMAFSFNNPQGMCPQCQGLGITQTLSLSKLIDQSKSLNQGAIRFPTFQPGGWRLARYTESGFFDNDLPIAHYQPEQKQLLLHGQAQIPPAPTKNWHKSAKYLGLIPRINQAFLHKENKKYPSELAGIIQRQECPACQGQRLTPHILSCKIHQHSIGDCINMPLTELVTFIQTLDQPPVSELITRLHNQLNTLITLGLGYLTLGRATPTLSGGESQRIKISKHLNSSLSDILYIFDEPSVGLHPHDLQALANTLKALIHKGNTVILIEHDPALISIADHIIDMGPGAAENGGQICFSGTYQQLLNSNSQTGNALSRPHQLKPQRRQFQHFYPLHHVSRHNLNNISIDIPKHSLTLITGVAGSGKSTLINQLFIEKYPQSILLNQTPIHTSDRANLATYLNIFDPIRSIFATATGQPPALFSFNSKGACPTCKGRGILKTDLAFIGDSQTPCEACHGTRYNPQALRHHYQGYRIDQILNMTASQALPLFPQPQLSTVLNMLNQVNLSYIKLGQPLSTFSGGELQRLKLANVLLATDHPIIILDEPSTGLHEADIDQLLALFDFILQQHKTLIVIEHNLSVICHADWLIDIGPGSGNQGGKLLYSGYLQGLLSCKTSHTAQHLAAYIQP